MAVFKVILVLSLIAVSFANTIPLTPEEPTPTTAIDAAPASATLKRKDVENILEAVDAMFERNVSFPELEETEGDETRLKRACRKVKYRNHYGRIIIIIRCY